MKIESIAGLKADSANASANITQREAKEPADVRAETGGQEEEAAKVSELTIPSKSSNDQQGSAKQDEGTREGQATEKQIKDAVSQANQRIKKRDGTRLEFSVHDGTQRVAIQVIDKETKEIIREIPPEKSLDMLQKMWELAGILVDERR